MYTHIDRPLPVDRRALGALADAVLRAGRLPLDLVK